MRLASRKGHSIRFEFLFYLAKKVDFLFFCVQLCVHHVNKVYRLRKHHGRPISREADRPYSPNISPEYLQRSSQFSHVPHTQSAVLVSSHDDIAVGMPGCREWKVAVACIGRHPHHGSMLVTNELQSEMGQLKPSGPCAWDSNYLSSWRFDGQNESPGEPHPYCHQLHTTWLYPVKKRRD